MLARRARARRSLSARDKELAFVLRIRVKEPQRWPPSSPASRHEIGASLPRIDTDRRYRGHERPEHKLKVHVTGGHARGERRMEPRKSHNLTSRGQR